MSEHHFRDGPPPHLPSSVHMFRSKSDTKPGKHKTIDGELSEEERNEENTKLPKMYRIIIINAKSI